MDILFIVGESGAGKTAAKERADSYWMLKDPVNYTTRKPRPSDKPGAYTFVTTEEFVAMLDAGQLAEHTFYDGNFYGIAAPQRDCVLVLEPVGLSMMKKWCSMNRIRYAVVYVTCDEGERVRRMVSRGDSREDAMRRVKHDRYFKESLPPGSYDWKIDTTGISEDEEFYALRSRVSQLNFFSE